MSDRPTPNEVPLTVEQACAISVECWRLGVIAQSMETSNEALRLHHATRRLVDALSAVGLEILDFTGRAYDPGLVPEVVEVLDDEALPEGRSIISETIFPTLTWRGQVIRPGQIIVKRSRSTSAESTEVTQ